MSWKLEENKIRRKFKDFTLANFWLNVSSSYPTLPKMQLLRFSYFQQHENANKGFLLLQSSRKQEIVW